MIIDGYITDKNRTPVEGASVEIKGENFYTVYETQSDENGHYLFDIPSGKYPFLIAVKDYGVKNLEYWCQNIMLTEDMSLDISFDKLEIYGLHAFTVKGAYPALMIYFRPMSLEKFQRGEKDIAPEIERIKITLDGKELPLLVKNRVMESIGEGALTAYLIQADRIGDKGAWHRLDVKIWDENDNFGMATIFN